MHHLTISPRALAAARAVVADPGSVRCHPALMGSAWTMLKAARGQSVDHSRLTPAHLIAPAAAPQPDDIDAIRQRSAIAIRAHIDRCGYNRPSGAGDAA